MARFVRFVAVMSELLRVIVNRQGGTAAAAGEELVQRIVSAFANAGREIDLSLIAGAEMAEAVRRASSESPLVVGGGDGTIGCAAQARVESGGGPLAILPLGTRNHLARELGIPLDLTEAAAVAVGGQPRRIDLASVNGHGFVNNASVGFYPLLVRWREQGRRRGMPKWLATIPASWAALRRFRHHRMHLRVGGGSKLVSTPILFVGNNRYVLERGQLGQRASLDDGLLSVFAVAARSRLGLMWFALRASVGLTDPARDFAALGECRELIVESRSHHIDIALDGEVLRLKPPLRFVVEVGAIEILARP